ncbi:DUF378 domain-containing protein [Oceanobacillus bengalensis]|uniref:DUF378 domain-containing protein n=1 Tax=Oceanobacillus bengalensis TaxID=1435466 RepID=A0A494YS23_9BACI|nr:DUF378 domain-containing protein [Oceanobacillus bengalensis]RKQ12460.1 DUF378 domain-containing protein [Oceanobacillus bengalensis]
MRFLKSLTLTLIIVGALNWGLIALFQFDLVAALFGGQDAILSRLVYGLVGLSGLYYVTTILNPTPAEVIDINTRQRIQPSQLKYGTEFGEEKHTENPHAHTLQTSEQFRKPPDIDND